MKKFILLMLCGAMLFSLAACGGHDAPGQTDGVQDGSQNAEDGQAPQDPASLSLEEMFEIIYSGVEDLPQLGIVEIDSENFSSYLFIEPVEGAEALASEAMISAIAHSAVLLRLPEGSDSQSVANEIRENADPRKWICVEAEKTLVTEQENMVLLVMSSSSAAEAITENFNALWA